MAETNGRETALQWATFRGHKELGQLLLEKELDADILLSNLSLGFGTSSPLEFICSI